LRQDMTGSDISPADRVRNSKLPFACCPKTVLTARPNRSANNSHHDCGILARQTQGHTKLVQNMPTRALGSHRSIAFPHPQRVLPSRFLAHDHDSILLGVMILTQPPDCPALPLASFGFMNCDATRPQCDLSYCACILTMEAMDTDPPGTERQALPVVLAQENCRLVSH